MFSNNLFKMHLRSFSYNMKITKNNVKNKNIFLIMLTSDTPKKKKKLLPHKDFYKRKTFVRILIIYRILKIWKVCCYF